MLHRRPASLALLALFACNKEEEVKPDMTPRLGVLELPTSLRIADPAPSGAATIEITPKELVVDGETLIPLENAKIPSGEKSGYEITKLKAKLSGKGAVAVSVYAAAPYATLARVLYTAKEAGVAELAFKVRKPNSSNQLGYIDLKQNTFIASPDASGFAESELVPWDKFAAVWDDALSGCQSAGAKADCGYAPMAKAQGGQLDMMLRVRSGYALRFRQAGAAATAAADAGVAGGEKSAAKDKKKGKKKKAEMLEGVKAAPEAAEETPPEPSHEHIFTLRTDQATIDPSPISGIVKPLCSSITCPIVFDVEGISMSSQVLAMLGAAFPDGTQAPRIAWVLPPKD